MSSTITSRALHLKGERAMSGNGSGNKGGGPATPERKLMAVMLQRVHREGQTYFVGTDGPMKLLMRPTGESQGDQPLWSLYVSQTAARR